MLLAVTLVDILSVPPETAVLNIVRCYMVINEII